MSQVRARAHNHRARLSGLPLLFAVAICFQSATVARVYAQSLQSRNQAVTAAGLAGQVPAVSQAVPSNQGLTNDAIAALQRQLSLQSRNQLAIQAMRVTQAAAANAALANPAMNLKSASGAILNGLGTGALDPAVSDQDAASGRTAAATALSQLKIWDGANYPTSGIKADGSPGTANDVNVDITANRAILSWNTFNAGKDTTLTFKPTTQLEDAGVKGWIALNRIVGGLDVNGRATPQLAPSQIFGRIQVTDAKGDVSKGAGTILVLNQNGIVFNGSSQLNVNTFIASTAEIGRAGTLVLLSGQNPPEVFTASTLADRNKDFLAFGLLGGREQVTKDVYNKNIFSEFSPFADSLTRPSFDNFVNFLTEEAPLPGAAISIAAGAQLSSNGGSIILNAPALSNAGSIFTPNGNTSLVSGSGLNIAVFDGTAGSGNAFIRGPVGYARLSFGPNALNPQGFRSSLNTGIISAPGGAIVVGSNEPGGILTSTTSVARNGYIAIERTMADSIVSILPDDSGGTIPQDPASLASFKPSKIDIAYYVGRNALVYAPGGTVTMNEQALVDAAPEATLFSNKDLGNASAIGPLLKPFFPGDKGNIPYDLAVETGAIIDVSGLKDVLLPASRNALKIGPLKGNELAGSPQYRDGFLNGATVYIDPRISGVRGDGVAWIGSPLIDAGSYAQQVLVSASELLTKGGNIAIGGQGSQAGQVVAPKNNVIAAGASLDISGGWTRYQAGMVPTTQLLGADGRTYDISQADPLKMQFIGLTSGFKDVHFRAGITETFGGLNATQSRFAEGYIEGRDAGTLVLGGIIEVPNQTRDLYPSYSSSVAFSGSIRGEAFAGTQQIANSQPGTGTPQFAWDRRSVQSVASQLPVGGAFRMDFEYPLEDAVFTRSDITISTDGVAAAVPYANAEQLALPKSFAADASNLSQVSIETTGRVSVGAGVNLNLRPGGIFDVLAGRAVTIDGSVTAPGGKILLQTVNGAVLSNTITSLGFIQPPELTDPYYRDNAAQLGSLFDVTVNGSLSAAGRWINDFGASSEDVQGSAFLNGGTISLTAAPRVAIPRTVIHRPGLPDYIADVTDISGSVLIEGSATVDLSSGGRADSTGKLNLTAKGGSLSLVNETTYFNVGYNTLANGSTPAASLPSQPFSGAFQDRSAFLAPDDPVPDVIHARVTLDPRATVRSFGFGGGGTFELVTPEFSFGSLIASRGTQLPIDFINRQGFSNYKITSYKTAIVDNKFYYFGYAPGTNYSNSSPVNYALHGYDAFLDTQTLTIGAGQTFALRNQVLPSGNFLSTDAATSLRGLKSGGDLYSVLQPTSLAETPQRQADLGYYRQPVNLTFGGLIELVVAPGGTIVGEAQSTLGANKLLNEGTIDIPGGTLQQTQRLQTSTPLPGNTNNKDIYSTLTPSADPMFAGQYLETAQSKIPGLTNRGAISDRYLLGILPETTGIELASGSVTNLAGVSLRDPFAFALVNGTVSLLQRGRLVPGGTIALSAQPIDLTRALSTGNAAFTAFGQKLFPAQKYDAYLGLSSSDVGRTLVADAGASIDISGANDTYDLPSASGSGYVQALQWTNGGAISAPNGGTFTGASLRAMGGDGRAAGGVLELLKPVIAASDPSVPQQNVLSAPWLQNSGIGTLIADGGISALGDASLTLSGALFVNARSVSLPSAQPLAGLDYPTIGGGGNLTIDAPYVRLAGPAGRLGTSVTIGNGAYFAELRGSAVDVTGLVAFDASVGDARLSSAGDIRLNGVADTSALTIRGELAAVKNLTLTAQRIYPTTASDFLIDTVANDGSITFGRVGQRANTPYSAGGSLSVYAANVIQGGALFAAHGTLNLGNRDAVPVYNSSQTFLFTRPATASLTFAPGSLTSVSGGSIAIPYGNTTDLTEWFFNPTNSAALSAPPAKNLNLGAQAISVRNGATVDLSGGGDLFAYEFAPGTGGSRDVLNQINPDVYTGNKGYLFPDKRQVYAIVPGLSAASLAVGDPLFSKGYDNLTSPSDAGKRVYLNGGGGFAAGWYTLLPAQYAVLPGGARIVEDTGANAVANRPAVTLADSTSVVTGVYGTIGSQESKLRQFDIQPQSLFSRYSKIVTTGANAYFSALAAKGDIAAPRLPADAGQLSILAQNTLGIQIPFLTAPGAGGRGAIADVSATDLYVTPTLQPVPAAGTVLPDGSIVRLLADGKLHLCAAAGDCSVGNGRLGDGLPLLVDAPTLDNIQASSLLLGARRVVQADGTVFLQTDAQRIVVGNDSDHPLYAPEILLAVGFSQNSIGGGVTVTPSALSYGEAIAVLNGAAIEARGAVTDISAGDYIATGGYDTKGTATSVIPAKRVTSGAFLRVANGPSRGIRRLGLEGDAPITFGNGPGFSGKPPSSAVLTQRYSTDLSVGSGATLKGQSILLDTGAYRNPTLSKLAPTLGGFKPSQSMEIAADANFASVTSGAPLSIELSAGSIRVGNTPDTSYNGLFVTGGLAAQLGAAAHLTLASNQAIAFAAGSYAFRDLSLLAPGLGTTEGPSGGDVSLTAARLTLGSRDAPSVCTAGGGVACNAAAALTVTVANNGVVPPELIFGGGSTATQFGGGVTLNAPGGVFLQNGDGGLDTGSGALTINTPFIADRATPLPPRPRLPDSALLALQTTFTADITIPNVNPGVLIPRDSFTSLGAVTITGVSGADLASVPGVPGSSIALNGGSVSVSGTHLRGTAGTIRVVSQGDLTLSNGAAVETPGYAASLGTIDPVTQNAQGGTLRLESVSGSLNLASGTVVSVAGGTQAAPIGNAGTIELVAPNAASVLNATLNGWSAAGGANLTADVGGGFDLTGFADRYRALGFTGALDIHSRQGNLDLLAGQSLVARSVSLIADALATGQGMVNIAGTIDTTAVDGGAISLAGQNGVILRSGARLIANATGYGYDAATGVWANDNPISAKAGDITLAVGSGGGQIALEAGAIIEARALQTENRIGRGFTGDRLVTLPRGTSSAYQFAAADRGGTVTFRAPVQSNVGQTALNITVAPGAAIRGVRGIVAQGVRSFDLDAIAPAEAGQAIPSVTITKDPATGINTAIIDPRGRYFGYADTTGASPATLAGGLPEFVQNFGLTSALKSQLQGLDPGAAFVAQPYADLSYNGSITLSRSWNLAAGQVDIARALSDGFFLPPSVDRASISIATLASDLTGNALAALPAGLSQLQVKDWIESQIFSNYTTLLYRTGGLPQGIAPALTLRARNTLTINGSISDGFFSFREQTGAYRNGGAFFSDSFSARPYYSADSNAVSPNDAGNTLDGTAPGDPFASMELFPRFAGGDGASGSAPLSSSLLLTGGAQTRSANLQATGTDATAALKVRGSYLYTVSSRGSYAIGVSPLIRTGSGSVFAAASGAVDLKGSETPILLSETGSIGTAQIATFTPPSQPGPSTFGSAIGGARIYTTGVRADTRVTPVVQNDENGSIQTYRIDTRAYLPASSHLVQSPPDISDNIDPRFLATDPVYANGGGDVTLHAGGDLIGQHDLTLSRLGLDSTQLWRGGEYQRGVIPVSVGIQGEQVDYTGTFVVGVQPQLFSDGAATLGGGDLAVTSWGSITNIAAVATTSLLTADVSKVQSPLARSSKALLTLGGGNAAVRASGSVLGGILDVGSGSGSISAGVDIGALGTGVRLSNTYNDSGSKLDPQLFRVRIADGDISIGAGRDLFIGSIEALGLGTLHQAALPRAPQSLIPVSTGLGYFGAKTTAALTANNNLQVLNDIQNIDTPTQGAALYPSAFKASALLGDLTLGGDLVSAVLRVPSYGYTYKINVVTVDTPGTNSLILSSGRSDGLQLFAGGSITPVNIVTEDSDPNQLPGLFTTNNSPLNTTGIPFGFPDNSPFASEATLRSQHTQVASQAGNPVPIRVNAGVDILNMLLDANKQTRIEAGRDIVNMAFFGQNLGQEDVTRIAAGRDLTATTAANGSTSSVQGNVFQIGGPGNVIVEAGRDAGPFLTSATVRSADGTGRKGNYGGGILSRGNELNPFLPEKGANVTVRFGVAKGEAWDAFQAAYLDPAGIAKLPADFFETVPTPAGTPIDRSKFVYAAQLIAWVKAHADDAYAAATGSTDYERAFNVFKALPLIRRELFLQEVYFQELIATAAPAGPSYLQYRRGYQAVNTLFPADVQNSLYGYTRNTLGGGTNGANSLVHTGDLDLRLATIESARGGDIRIMGPGGRVVGGSVVRTDEQTTRRSFTAGGLFQGNQANNAQPQILAIPTGLEGVLSLRGGSLYSFTDGDFLLNQSRAYTRQGGDIGIWSSNADVNAGQGPKTSANFPALVVRCDYNGICQNDVAGSTTGAGIAAFQPDPGIPAPDVYLIAPRGAVDAGDAGVRVAGNLSIAALVVRNADNFQVGGISSGVPAAQAPDLGALNTAGAVTGAAAQESKAPTQNHRSDSIIIVEIVGFGGDDGKDDACPAGMERIDRKCRPRSGPPQRGALRKPDPDNLIQIAGAGRLAALDAQR